jgi:hypothetical protein
MLKVPARTLDQTDAWRAAPRASPPGDRKSVSLQSDLAAAVGPATITFIVNALARILRRAWRSGRHASRGGRHPRDRSWRKWGGYAAGKTRGQGQNRTKSGHLNASETHRPRTVYQTGPVTQRNRTRAWGQRAIAPFPCAALVALPGAPESDSQHRIGSPCDVAKHSFGRGTVRGAVTCLSGGTTRP